MLAILAPVAAVVVFVIVGGGDLELGIWLALGLLAGLASGWLFTRRGGGDALLDAVRQFSQGDFSVRLPETAKGAALEKAQLVNQLGEALTQRQQQLLVLATQTEEVAGQLTHCAEQNAQDRSMDAMTETVNGAMEELTQNVEAVAGNAAAAADAARQADSGADSGKVTMTDAIGAMDATSGELSRAKDALERLSANSEDIGGVLEVIRGIAEQTNMLALNAAIEAARAGDQGRGFAVVADEVRTLASRTQQSTEEIQTMIERLQNGSREVVDVVEEGSKQAQVCEELIETACVSFAEIAGAVATIDQMGAEIQHATEQQSESVRAIQETVANGLARANEDCGSDGALEIASSLHGLSEQLRQLA